MSNQTTTTTTDPTTMKAIQVHQFVEPMDSLTTPQANEFLTMNDQVPLPTSLKKNEMLIQVLACSISPGDVIMVQGNLIFMHPPAFPFTPGMDICGIVVDANESTKFSKGDIVVAANGMTFTGGMAQYMVIQQQDAALKPRDVAINQAAASSSAITARNAVMDHVRKGDRVLILGGSGGVGSAAIQMAKQQAQASFVATTSTQTQFCQALGADQVIDYRTENWWEFKGDDKYDVIIDTVGGGNFYGRATRVLKPAQQGGVFVAVCGDDKKPDCRTVWKAVKFFAKMPWRPLYTWMRTRTLPKYVLLMPYDVPQGRQQVLEWMQQGALQIPIDEDSPMPFTEQGVRQAFVRVASGHAHGKVVVTMQD